MLVITPLYLLLYPHGYHGTLNKSIECNLGTNVVSIGNIGSSINAIIWLLLLYLAYYI